MLKFEYRVGRHEATTPGQLEDWLNEHGARGFRLAMYVPHLPPVLERVMGEDEEPAAPEHGEPSVARQVPAGELVEFLCGCGCGEVGQIPESMVATMTSEKLLPFVKGHGPRAEIGSTYLAPAPKK